MEYPDQSEMKDLNLRFRRRQGAGWEELSSAGQFVTSLRRQQSGHGTVFAQGVFVDEKGKEMSLQQVANLVDAHGADAIHHLDGDFVIAVDDRRHGVWCATDATTSFPLYYKLTRDELVITTRAENMTAKSADDLDLECIVTVLSSGYPWGDLTLLKDWKALRPGYMIRIDRDDNDAVAAYFDPEHDEKVLGYKSSEELIESIDRGLRSIASRYGRILIPLSGGVDSRLVAVRCHALGIPFEAITFVANVPDGADFDIAARVARVLGVKHHRWQWDASSAECLGNFERLCHATGGMNDAYTSYPDGMNYFAQVAAEFDCVLRGDHVLGWGPYCDSTTRGAWLLGMKLTDNLDWALRQESRNKVNIASIFEKQEGVSAEGTGDAVNAWKHASYRRGRSPRFIMPIAQLQAQFVTVANPLQSKEIISRVSRTDTTFRDDKRIALEALAASSPPDVKKIPFADQSTWQSGEPLLDVAPDVLEKMIDVATRPGILSEIVDSSIVVGNFKAFLNGDRSAAKKGLLGNVKKMIRDALPARILAMYDEKVIPSIKTPSYMTFKRFFAMKVYLDRISRSQ